MSRSGPGPRPISTFQLWDIRRLVAYDTPAGIKELKRLRNTRYHDRPVSL